MKLDKHTTSVLFVSFSLYKSRKRTPANGMINPVLWYFLPRVKSLLLLDQPVPESDTLTPKYEEYANGKLRHTSSLPVFVYWPVHLLCTLQNTDKTHISFKIRDLISVLSIPFLFRKRYDLFIGLESINTIAGIFLRKIGMVRNVVYYVSDYSPRRYGDSLFTTVYLWLDKFCVEHADFTWDVSPAIQKARIREGIVRNTIRSVIVVPNGLFPEQIRPLPVSKRTPDSVIYMGLLNKDQGLDLALRAFRHVLDKRPRAKFHIIGSISQKSDFFSDLVTKLQLEDAIVAHGFIPPDKQMSSIISRCRVGIVAYRRNGNPRNAYGDSGKVKAYLGCGLPIVTTKLQSYSKYVIAEGAGIGVAENPRDFASAILKLLTNKTRYKKTSDAALKLSKHNTWEKTYNQAFEKMRALS